MEQTLIKGQRRLTRWCFSLEKSRLNYSKVTWAYYEENEQFFEKKVRERCKLTAKFQESKNRYRKVSEYSLD